MAVSLTQKQTLFQFDHYLCHLVVCTGYSNFFIKQFALNNSIYEFPDFALSFTGLNSYLINRKQH